MLHIFFFVENEKDMRLILWMQNCKEVAITLGTDSLVKDGHLLHVSLISTHFLAISARCHFLPFLLFSHFQSGKEVKVLTNYFVFKESTSAVWTKSSLLSGISSMRFVVERERNRDNRNMSMLSRVNVHYPSMC